ncbi:MAG: pitrilysin family protein, partial [bacterium]|nr:pitrilysin family protein [bacterium]
KEINGISHFLEHMFFKGTKKRPSTAKLIEPLDKIGGEYNAFTGQENTGYWAKVDSKHLDVALNWVSDIFLNSKLESTEIEREKGVIIEEINMYLDDPKRYVSDLWDKLLYGDQPAGWLISGEKESVKQFKRDNFTNYLENHYSATNTVICVAGNIGGVEKLKKKIEEKFKKINIQKPGGRGRVVFSQKQPEILLHYKNTDQTHLCLGVRAYNNFHKDKYVLRVLSAVLGGGMSSRMWISVRERKGLAYYVWVYNNVDLDAGFLLTQAGVNNDKIDEAIKEILNQFKLIKNRKISTKELRKAKDYIKGGAILGMESSDAQASFCANQELMENRILTLDKIFAKIEAVTAKDIQRVAKDIFRPEKLNLALIGPFKDKSKFEKIIKI